MPRVVITHIGQTVYEGSLGTRGVRFGRAPDNDVVLQDETVSGYHAILVHKQGEVVLRDFNSTNGTFLDGVPIEPESAVSRTGTVKFGPKIQVSVEVLEAFEGESEPLAVLLDVDNARVAHVFQGHQCMQELWPRDELEVKASLSVGHGAVTLRTGAVQRSLHHGDDFTIGSRTFRLVSAAGMATLNDKERPAERWMLEIAFQGRFGPIASFTSPDHAQRHTISAPNRVALLHLLQEQLRTDLRDLVPESDAGWCQDTDLMRGIWGHRWKERGKKSQQVLVHRVRQDLARIDVHPHALEKHQRRTRLRPGLFQVGLGDLESTRNTRAHKDEG